MRSTFNPSNDMVSAAHYARTIARKSAEDIISAAKRANDAIVDLPAINEEGNSVMHGANNWMIYVRDDLLTAFDFLRFSCGSDYHDLLKYTHKYAALGGAKFHSDAEWNEKGDHLEKLIPVIRARIGTNKELF